MQAGQAEAGQALAVAFGAIIAASGTRADLTVRQLAVLGHVVRAPGVATVRDMSAALNVGKPAVTRALDRLEMEGFARRRTSGRDRRVVLVDVLPAGVQFAHAVFAAIRSA